MILIMKKVDQINIERGLYDASYEHDACGVGMLVNIHGGKSHDLVDSALKVLENMRHRGAEGADNKTGDVLEFYFRFLMNLFYYREFQFRKKGNMVLG